MTNSSEKNAANLTLLPDDAKAADKKEPPAPGGQADKLFGRPRELVDDFVFDADTVAVFDDMVGRSVPFYQEIQRMVCELSAEFAVPGTNLYDLGCSTGTTLRALHDAVDPEVRFVGIDNSDEMIEVARHKLAPLEAERHLALVNADLNEGVMISNASVVVMVLSMMFVRPLRRQRLVECILAGLPENGCLIMVEKITGAHTLLNRLFIKNYYEYKKRKGYSELEISQKREALENILIPYRFEEDVGLLHESGFSQIDEFFRWYNFCGIVAVK